MAWLALFADLVRWLVVISVVSPVVSSAAFSRNPTSLKRLLGYAVRLLTQPTVSYALARRIRYSPDLSKGCRAQPGLHIQTSVGNSSHGIIRDHENSTRTISP